MDAVIKVRPNGSYKVIGPARLLLADGTEVEVPEGESIALCRCGQSSTKPYCDSTHKLIGFVDPVPAEGQAAPAHDVPAQRASAHGAPAHDVPAHDVPAPESPVTR